MSEDWRVEVDPQQPGHGQALFSSLQAKDLEHDLSSEFGNRIAASRDDDTVFLYAGSRDQAEAAREFVAQLAGRQGWGFRTELHRWHPIAEDWEDPDLPLPQDHDSEEAEHATLEAREQSEDEERGYPEFEVRIDLPSRHEAIELAKRLDSEGMPAVRRWRYLLVGAADDAFAEELAERIRTEAPVGSNVKVEGTWKAVTHEMPSNPFAVFGGLGG